MLKIKSEEFTFNGKQADCMDFLSDLNNYKNLFPKDKIKNWKSEETYCEFNLQNAYTLEILKESVTENIIFLKAIDEKNGEDACFTKRITNSNEKILIGGKETYIACSRKTYNL